MYFSYDRNSDENLYPLSASDVREIIMMNRNGVKPDTLLPEPVSAAPEFVTAAGEGSITRFDKPRNKKKSRGGKKSRNGR